MERPIKKYKRNIKQSQYKSDYFKKQMKINNFRKERPIFYPFNKEFKIKMIKQKSISKRLGLLSEDLQKKIYVISMRKYSQRLLLSTSLKPLWWDYQEYLNNEIKKSTVDNVHFMHLDFNILPEKKEWIPGCECSFCKDYKNNHSREVDQVYSDILDDPLKFNEIIKCYELIPNKWNTYINYYGEPPNYTTFVIFDPLKNMYDDPIREDPHESPIYFSEEITSLYSPDEAKVGDVPLPAPGWFKNNS